ncbi:MAG TPA: hypothetical protein VM487_24300 [Phycisphaerae bacterium]|nr:hypothetical protein [Phycisphaerae bacterium]
MRCLAKSITEIRGSVNVFNAEARANPDCVRSLLSLSRYWVYDPIQDMFAPAKFAGFASMDFQMYLGSRRDEVPGDKFDGHLTRIAVEEALGVAFVDDPSLRARLADWGQQLYGADLSGVNTAKWRFASLPTPDAR